MEHLERAMEGIERLLKRSTSQGDSMHTIGKGYITGKPDRDHRHGQEVHVP